MITKTEATPRWHEPPVCEADNPLLKRCEVCRLYFVMSVHVCKKARASRRACSAECGRKLSGTIRDGKAHKSYVRKPKPKPRKQCPPCAGRGFTFVAKTLWADDDPFETEENFERRKCLYCHGTGEVIA